jgi:hypothetical protein
LPALRITISASIVLPTLVILLGIQHCISVHRDVLKLTGQQWMEVRILVGSLTAATLAHFVVSVALRSDWLTTVAAMCFSSALVQLYLSARVFKPSPMPLHGPCAHRRQL